MSIHKEKLIKSLSGQAILDAMPEVAYVSKVSHQF